MRKLAVFIGIMLALAATSAYSFEQKCAEILNTTVPPGGEAHVIIRLSPSAVLDSSVDQDMTGSMGMFTFQPFITSGTFTFKVYFSNVKNVPTSDQWDNGRILESDVTSSSDGKCYLIDPLGPHAWMKINASETSGSGSPALTGNLCVQ